jgi:hypothetical protein
VDKVIRKWDIESGQCLQQYQYFDEEMAEVRQQLDQLCLSLLLKHILQYATFLSKVSLP